MPEAKSIPTDDKVDSKNEDKQLLVYEQKRLKDKVTATLPPQSSSPIEDSGNRNYILNLQI